MQSAVFFAKSAPGAGDIVEIGSFAGKSTIWLANGVKLRKRGKIYAVDPHTGDPYSGDLENVRQAFSQGQEFEFRKNIGNAGVSDVVIPVVKTSQEAAKDFDKAIRFLFIDGIHQYDFVKLDFLFWSPKVIGGGIIAFHDSNKEGVNRLLCEYLYGSDDYKFMGTVHSLTFFRKGSGKPFLDKIFVLRFNIVFPQHKNKGYFGVISGLLLRILGLFAL